MLEAHAFRHPVLLAGPKGIGKTLLLQHLAKALGAPWVAVDGTEDIRRSTLAGLYTLQGNDTAFIPGAVTTAVDLANETGKCVLALEEVNALPPSIQKMLNPLTDFRRAWDVPEARLSLRLRPDAKLWVVGTLNYVSGGIYDLNPDLLSRFRVYSVGHPSPEEEQAMIEAAVPTHKFTRGVLAGLTTLAKETRTGEFGYELSLRDLVGVAEDMNVLGGTTAALEGIVGKFPLHTQEDLRQRFQSIFGRKK